MAVAIPDDILEAAHMPGDELLRELAIHLFEVERLTLGHASKLAGMSQAQFQHLLAGRGVSPHYDVADLAEDVRTLRELGRL